MARWTHDQVQAAAPDAASLTAARKLAHPGPWRETGCTDSLVWGQCQGSGKKPYQVSIDVLAPAYRCSCPSRKFPCKHGLALLMLWSDGVLDESGQVAEHAGEWAAGRAAKVAAQADRDARADAPTAPVDEEARARRVAERLARMDAGVEDLRLWLEDLVRGGLASARRQGHGWWDGAAARLVDAQVPGLAERVRRLGELAARPDWDETLLPEVGRLWTVTAAWLGRDALSPEEQAEVRVAVGWALPSAEVRDADSRPGPWTVLGAHRSDDGTLQSQRTWLRHGDGEVVQVLDFAGQGQSLAVPQLSGAVIDVEVARYPGLPPRRALFVDLPTSVGVAARADAAESASTIAALVAAAGESLAAAPWRTRVPALLGAVRPAPADADHRRWQLVDADGAAVPLVAGPELWSLVALTGGRPADVFGEWDGHQFLPLTVWSDDGAVPL